MLTLLKYFGLPIQASAQAAEIDRLIALVHWLMLVLFVGWAGYFIITLFRFRQSKNPKAIYTGVKSHFSSYVEAGVAVVEGILLIGFAIPAWARHVSAFPAEKDSIVVRVAAEQFAWNVHYPGPDGIFGRTDPRLISAGNPLGLDRRDPSAKDDITTINQLNLPVDRPVLVRLSTKDVIHSFGIPVMRVKQDAIPGFDFPVWFTPTKTGAYEIACNQLCGLGHYRMRGFVTVQPPQQFQAWVAEQEAANLKEQGGGSGK